MRLGWNRDEDGVITVFAHASDGRGAAVADFWLQPLIDKFGMRRDAAKELQQQFAELLVFAHNKHFTQASNDGGFAMQAPPSSLDSTAPDEARVTFACPIKREGCQQNCGSYGCGN